MSKNELSPEVLAKLENAAVGTLAKKAKDGDTVAARALLDRVDKLRKQPRAGRIPLVTNAAEAAALIAGAPKSPNRARTSGEIANQEPPPPLPSVDLDPADFLDGMYHFLAWSVTGAAQRHSSGSVDRMISQMREIYAELTKIRKPGRRSIWDGTPEERTARFAIAVDAAPLELLEACAAELRRREQSR